MIAAYIRKVQSAMADEPDGSLSSLLQTVPADAGHDIPGIPGSLYVGYDNDYNRVRSGDWVT